jgi:hypothetical protein
LAWEQAVGEASAYLHLLGRSIELDVALEKAAAFCWLGNLLWRVSSGKSSPHPPLLATFLSTKRYLTVFSLRTTHPST